MHNTAYAGYRDRLALLADDTALLHAIADDAVPPASWRRVYGRFSPGAATYALVVLKREESPQAIHTIEVHEAEPQRLVHKHVVRHEALGWITISQFPYDLRLHTLACALACAGSSTVVRYRPGKRCTFRVDRGFETFFCKVFPDDSGARLHAESRAIWDASSRGELGFEVAEPVRWDGETRTLWQRSIGGAPVYPLLAGPDGPAYAWRLGEAAGTLPRSSVVPGERFDARVQCRRSWGYAREIGTRVPKLAAPAAALVASLEATHDTRPARLRTIHGAPHMNQWLDIDGRLGLVDFDRLSVGDPELDVATFLGELDFEGGLAHDIDDLARAFVSGYESTAGPLDEELLRAYRSHKRLAKALRSVRALRPDGDARAERHLQTAVSALEVQGVV